MAYSREQLVLLALESLGAGASGQTPSAEDKKYIDDRFNAVMDDLAERNVYAWGDPDQTPNAAALHIAVCLAQADPRPFGKVRDEVEVERAERRLVALRQTILTGQPQQVEWY